MADLTIIMPCWNKQDYIAAALDSVFAQRTSFTYEIVIADDHSTDRTLEIVAEYERLHPGLFTVLRSDTNLKLFRNVRRAYAICKTPYFCVLDPDDYWTDERHLEKALSFLAAHPDFTIYSAGIEQLLPDGTRQSCGFPTEVIDSDFRDFVKQRAAIAFTQTCVYRNVVFSKGLPPLVANPETPSMEKSFRGDTFRNFLHIREGRSHFEPAVEACYRVTDEGVYQGISHYDRLMLNARMYTDFYRYDGRRHRGLRRLAKRMEREAMHVLESAQDPANVRDLPLPEIGFGTFPQKETLLDSIPAAIAAGYRLVDTSDNYFNEEFVGRALAKCSPTEVIRVSKFSDPLATGRLERNFDASRAKLGGRIDVYLLHWPYPFLWPLQWRKLERLVLSGRCRAIGVCNFDRRRLERLLRFCRVRPAVNQLERHPLFQQRETVEFCRANSIRVMCYSPLARNDASLLENPVLLRIAAAHGKTVGQVILRWNIQHGDLPIPASRSPTHIAENFAALGFALSDAEMSSIDALDCGHRVRFDPDRRFGFAEKLRYFWCRLKLALGGT